ncbi:MAG: SDR family NAD(P)-dependent oxidoreductase [Pseudomonadota bacterium]
MDINDEAGNKTVQDIQASGGQAVYVNANVAEASDCERMVQTAEDTFGHLHILFNNAGISHAQDDDVDDRSHADLLVPMSSSAFGVLC